MSTSGGPVLRPVVVLIAPGGGRAGICGRLGGIMHWAENIIGWHVGTA